MTLTIKFIKTIHSMKLYIKKFSKTYYLLLFVIEYFNSAWYNIEEPIQSTISSQF